jgi:hypothetical protein
MKQAVRFSSNGTRLMTRKFADGFGGSAQDRAAMERLFSVILDKYDAEAAARGYPNDLALALVSFIGLNSRVYSGAAGNPVLPFEQNPELRNMIAEYAAQNGAFDNMTNRQRQEMYEALVMVGAFTHLIYEEARRQNNSQALEEIKFVAKQNLKSIGVEP